MQGDSPGIHRSGTLSQMETGTDRFRGELFRPHKLGRAVWRGVITAGYTSSRKKRGTWLALHAGWSILLENTQ